MGKRIYLNDGWTFVQEYKQGMEQGNIQGQGVRLPHSVVETPFHYFDESVYQMVSIYERTIDAKKEWENKTVLLTFEGVAHQCDVYLNGKKIADHACGYTAFSVDIAKKLIMGEENRLSVVVDSRESINVPPFGFVIDYMTYGGIYRDVYLDVKNEIYLEDVYLSTDIRPEIIHSEVTISAQDNNLIIRQSIRKKGTEKYTILSEYQAALLVEKRDLMPGQSELWNVDRPVLYEVKTELIENSTTLDEVTTIIGFRRAEWRKDGFYLNGDKLKIRGLNRHQSYPYVGYAMPDSIQKNDADILKKELGLNAVRTSHYPQSHAFLDRCDEIGLLVFTEMPGWQYIGDENWKMQAVQNCMDMIKQYRNHTSIVLWGVRINESRDDDELYRRTCAVARLYDPYRATGGVRAHKKSSLLEDVYTYNDFVHEGNNKGCEAKKKVTGNMEQPYLVTEYNGHMFPTKSFDWEEHRLSHTLRHAKVLEDITASEDICGSFGWCMADYNTHKDFGSGDRICYHGVLDMFRNPKMASYVYSCEQDQIPVLEVSSTFDIGEHPGCNRNETYIFTNADSVRMYKNGRFLKEYTQKDSPYKHLKHGPILIDDYIGDAIEKGEKWSKKQAGMVKELMNLTARYGYSHLPKRAYILAARLVLFYHMNPNSAVELYNKYVGDWGQESTVYRFVAIKDGKVVKELTKDSVKKIAFEAVADQTILEEGKTYDVAAVRIRAIDQNGNTVPYFQEPVKLSVNGPVELIGGELISLKGGMGGTYVRTTGEEGTATLRIENASFATKEVHFSIIKGDGE